MLDTLRACASGGFPADQVEASMNTVEFRLREFNTGGFPRGLSFMLGAMSEWLFDRDAIDALLKRQSTPLKRTAKLDTQGSVTFSLHFVEAVAGDLNA